MAPCRVRNTATNKVRDAKHKFEKKIALESGTNPRAFHSYARSKTKIKEEVTHLRKPDGSFTATAMENCTLLNGEFKKNLC